MNRRKLSIRCHPDCAQYSVNQQVTLVAESVMGNETVNCFLKVFHLATLVKEFPIALTPGEGILIPMGTFSPGGYGVEIVANGKCISETAFDVVKTETDYIRYGFVSEFTKKDEDTRDIDFAIKMHLNALQFYDWMCQHEQLSVDQIYYKNPLGIEISRAAVTNKIVACKKANIKPYAYGAVYAASKDFYESHKEFAIRQKNGSPMVFANWLVYMNVSPDCGWNDYIINQFKNAINDFGFLGIHMDTYGYPKFGWSNEMRPVDLEQLLPLLIQRAEQEVKKVNAHAGVIFNAVNDWPTEKVAGRGQEAMYIEVWPPNDTYRDLYLLIKKAKAISTREVILAAYLKPFAEISSRDEEKKAEKACLLTFAVIHAAGGHQLIFGENGGLLCDSYYVHYKKLTRNFLKQVQHYCDFIVRFEELLDAADLFDISRTASDGINEDICFHQKSGDVLFNSSGKPNQVWTIIHKCKNYLVVQLINLLGENEYWNEAKSGQTHTIQKIQIDFLMEDLIKGVYYSSPDDATCKFLQLEYNESQQDRGRCISVTLPDLRLWGLLWIETENER